MLGLSPADGDDKARSMTSSREQRRLSIKAAKVLQRKQESDIAAMCAEDKRSKLENDAFRVRVIINRDGWMDGWVGWTPLPCSS